jgi:hypothetical protein
VPHSIDLWTDEPLIKALGGNIRVIPGQELLVTGRASTWRMPITMAEINRGDDLYFEVRSDGQRVFIGGPEVIAAFLVDFALAKGSKISLLRSRRREEWDPGGLTMMEIVPLEDGRLLVVYESGILVLNERWDLQWHRQLSWVHLGFFPDPVKGDVVWMNSDWGKIGYRLADGTVLDPDGLYAWRVKQEGTGQFTGGLA